MNYIFKLIVFFFGTVFINSQVAIGKPEVSNSSVSMEFGNENRGIILPWVEDDDTVEGQINGSIVYDLSEHKVKVKLASGWKDLSINENGTTVDPVSGVDGVLIQNAGTENPDAKATIGPGTTTEKGILILEDSTKAMVLPKVASPHLNIINPSPGMMVYDTTAKQLAVYNGAVWSFWKP